MIANKYKKIKLPDGSTRDLHRIIMENQLGRKLDFNECVHHINEDKTDNSLSNLILVSRAEHSRGHKRHILTTEDCRKGSRARLAQLKAKHTDGKFICSKCKNLLLPECFSKNKSKWNGLQSYCKICSKFR